MPLVNRRMDIDVHVHEKADPEVVALLTEIRDLLVAQGEQMATLEEAIANANAQLTALQGRLDEDWQNAMNTIAALQAEVTSLSEQLVTATGNDAADAATIAQLESDLAAKQAELDAMVASVQPATNAVQGLADQLAAIDLDPSNPTVTAPPAESTETPPEG